MAETHVAHDAPEMDYPEHEKTYENFLAMTKWGVIFMVLLMVFMAIFLT